MFSYKMVPVIEVAIFDVLWLCVKCQSLWIEAT